MTKYLLMGVGNASDGREDDYRDWYQSIHIPDILALPGVISARRYEVTSFGLTPPPGAFLGVFEVETDDIAGVMQELRRRSSAGDMKMSDAVDLTTTQLWIYEQQQGSA